MRGIQTGMQEKIPPVKKRPSTVHVQLFAVVHRKGDRYLMKPADGMWEFPMFPELPSGSFKTIGQCRHTITHHRLEVSVCEGKIETKDFAWKDIGEIPISSLTRKIWNTVSIEQNSPPCSFAQRERDPATKNTKGNTKRTKKN